jgi:hypothetical protein
LGAYDSLEDHAFRRSPACDHRQPRVLQGQETTASTDWDLVQREVVLERFAEQLSLAFGEEIKGKVESLALAVWADRSIFACNGCPFDVWPLKVATTPLEDNWAFGHGCRAVSPAAWPAALGG